MRTHLLSALTGFKYLVSWCKHVAIAVTWAGVGPHRPWGVLSDYRHIEPVGEHVIVCNMCSYANSFRKEKSTVRNSSSGVDVGDGDGGSS